MSAIKINGKWIRPQQGQIVGKQIASSTSVPSTVTKTTTTQKLKEGWVRQDQPDGTYNIISEPKKFLQRSKKGRETYSTFSQHRLTYDNNDNLINYQERSLYQPRHGGNTYEQQVYLRENHTFDKEGKNTGGWSKRTLSRGSNTYLVSAEQRERRSSKEVSREYSTASQNRAKKSFLNPFTTLYVAKGAGKSFTSPNKEWADNKQAELNKLNSEYTTKTSTQTQKSLGTNKYYAGGIEVSKALYEKIERDNKLTPAQIKSNKEFEEWAMSLPKGTIMHKDGTYTLPPRPSDILQDKNKIKYVPVLTKADKDVLKVDTLQRIKDMPKVAKSIYSGAMKIYMNTVNKLVGDPTKLLDKFASSKGYTGYRDYVVKDNKLLLEDAEVHNAVKAFAYATAIRYGMPVAAKIKTFTPNLAQVMKYYGIEKIADATIGDALAPHNLKKVPGLKFIGRSSEGLKKSFENIYSTTEPGKRSNKFTYGASWVPHTLAGMASRLVDYPVQEWAGQMVFGHALRGVSANLVKYSPRLGLSKAKAELLGRAFGDIADVGPEIAEVVPLAPKGYKLPAAIGIYAANVVGDSTLSSTGTKTSLPQDSVDTNTDSSFVDLKKKKVKKKDSFFDKVKRKFDFSDYRLSPDKKELPVASIRVTKDLPEPTIKTVIDTRIKPKVEVRIHKDLREKSLQYRVKSPVKFELKKDSVEPTYQFRVKTPKPLIEFRVQQDIKERPYVFRISTPTFLKKLKLPKLKNMVEFQLQKDIKEKPHVFRINPPKFIRQVTLPRLRNLVRFELQKDLRERTTTKRIRSPVEFKLDKDTKERPLTARFELQKDLREKSKAFRIKSPLEFKVQKDLKEKDYKIKFDLLKDLRERAYTATLRSPIKFKILKDIDTRILKLKLRSPTIKPWVKIKILKDLQQRDKTFKIRSPVKVKLQKDLPEKTISTEFRLPKTKALLELRVLKDIREKTFKADLRSPIKFKLLKDVNQRIRRLEFRLPKVKRLVEFKLLKDTPQKDIIIELPIQKISLQQKYLDSLKKNYKSSKSRKDIASSKFSFEDIQTGKIHYFNKRSHYLKAIKAHSKYIDTAAGQRAIARQQRSETQQARINLEKRRRALFREQRLEQPGKQRKSIKKSGIVQDGKHIFVFRDIRTGQVRTFTKRSDYIRALKQTGKFLKTKEGIRLQRDLYNAQSRPSRVESERRRIQLLREAAFDKPGRQRKAPRAYSVKVGKKKVYVLKDAFTGEIRSFNSRKQYLRAIKYQNTLLQNSKKPINIGTYFDSVAEQQRLRALENKRIYNLIKGSKLEVVKKKNKKDSKREVIQKDGTVVILEPPKQVVETKLQTKLEQQVKEKSKSVTKSESQLQKTRNSQVQETISLLKSSQKLRANQLQLLLNNYNQAFAQEQKLAFDSEQSQDQKQKQRFKQLQKLLQIQKLSQQTKQELKVVQKLKQTQKLSQKQALKQVQKLRQQQQLLLRQQLLLKTKVPTLTVTKIDPPKKPKKPKKDKRRKKKKYKTSIKREQDPFYRITGKKKYSDLMSKLLRDRYGNVVA